MQRLFFLHVPKTGGTSIDSLLAEQTLPQRSLRNLQMSSAPRHWLRLADPALDYLSGHVPAGCLDIDRFDERITILRAPGDLIMSAHRFMRAMGVGETFLDRLLAAGQRYSVYREYFSPFFDGERLIGDLRYGIAGAQHLYAEDCSVPQALQMLGRFDRVLDFAHLEREAMRLVMEKRLFPASTPPRRRRTPYAGDAAIAAALLSQFDTRFFKAARQRFRPLPADTEASYQRYRLDYASNHGVRLPLATTWVADLARPVGSGWLDAEVSELGDTYRWAETERARLEIPVALPGRYALHVYVHPHEVRGQKGWVHTLVGGHRHAMRRQEHGALAVMHAQIELAERDWIEVQFDGELPDSARPASVAHDTRAFVLGRALLRRLP